MKKVKRRSQGEEQWCSGIRGDGKEKEGRKEGRRKKRRRKQKEMKKEKEEKEEEETLTGEGKDYLMISATVFASSSSS